MADNPGLDEMNEVVCCGIHATIRDVVASMVSARSITFTSAVAGTLSPS